MFVRYVSGRAYLAESAWVGGRPVQLHLGPADSDSILLVGLLAAERDEQRQEQRQRRDEEQERDRELAEHWARVRREFESTMISAGYHNPSGRGWRKRRAAKSAR
jgi:hypothetical protein